MSAHVTMNSPRGRSLAAAVLAIVWLSGVMTRAQEGVATTEQVFKSVKVLTGIPLDTFFDTMGMFANAMGNDCTFCHSSKAALDRAAFAEQTPRIVRARQMIAMMNAINMN